MAKVEFYKSDSMSEDRIEIKEGEPELGLLSGRKKEERNSIVTHFGHEYEVKDR